MSPAGRRVVTDSRLIPTGQYKPMDIPDPFLLENRTLDDGFVDLIRDSDGRARFYIASSGKMVEVLFGPKWQAAVVWEPNAPNGQAQDFICFEPMAGITDAVNRNHDGNIPSCKVFLRVAPGPRASGCGRPDSDRRPNSDRRWASSLWALFPARC